jgi:hypothetical protein
MYVLSDDHHFPSYPISFKLPVYSDRIVYPESISWWSVLLVEETGVPGEDHRPVARMYNALHTMISENKIITYVKSSYLVFKQVYI